MLKIVYCKEGIANADCKSEELALQLINFKAKEYKTSTESLILAFRVLVHEKKISNKDIEIIYNNKKVELNENGRIHNWEEGFCDTSDKFYFRILDM